MIPYSGYNVGDLIAEFLARFGGDGYAPDRQLSALPAL